ncbi:MAG: carboxypeptidase regulatory-like domain-containing protein [Euryarchaeota archaeon]|jgi:hypothetical protein|nr:carboxypeptidase regulatory-like domain-containing protein [Euryarchaeota archaeon]MBT7987491.1 carboxypeptidase regulatory-like domain-containing protein [Euryarchaeota archaeon]
MAEKTYEQRRSELRKRVQSQIDSPNEQVHYSDFDQNDEIMEEEIVVKPMIDLDYDERSKLRMIAAIAILIGSILGIISGGILLQGNPDDLLNSSLFNEAETVDLTGQVLTDDGVAINNATIQLYEDNSNSVIQTVITNDNGYFQLEDVKPETMVIRVVKEDFSSLERTFIAEDGLMSPFTMKSGESSTIIQEDFVGSEGGWTLEAAVALSTFLGVMTIITGFVGIQASVETRRASRYRRTQYLAGISLFSRGLIWIGPILILAGMALNSLVKDQYEDYLEE